MKRRAEHISINELAGAFTPLREIETVIWVSRSGGASKAAAILGYAQSTVTLHIHTVEEYLGIKVFERAGRGLELTRAGRALVEHGSALISEARAFRSRVLDVSAGGSVGIAIIEPTATHRFPKVIALLAAENPEIHVDVRVVGTSAATELVRSREVDFALCSRPRDVEDLCFQEIFQERLAVLVPLGHRLAHRAKLALSDLSSDTLLLGDDACAYRYLVESALDAGHVDVALRANFGNVSTLPFGVAAGLGIAVVPEFSNNRPLSGTRLIPLMRPTLSLRIGTLRRRDSVQSDAVRRTHDATVQTLRPHPVKSQSTRKVSLKTLA